MPHPSRLSRHAIRRRSTIARHGARSAAELPGLDLIVNWAKKARLVRRQGTRLVPVAKARPLLADAEALWQRA